MSTDPDSSKRPARGRGRPVSLVKRRAILEAAIAEFQKRGYQGASMDAVAAAAGVSKRTLYNHFPNKKALFGSLAEEMGKRVSLFSRIAYQRDVPLRTQLSRYAHASAKLIHDPETLALFRAVLAEHVRNPDLVANAMARYWRDEYGFVAWVSAARRDGKLRARSPERAGHHFASLIKGAAVWPFVLRQAPPTAKEIKARINEAIEMFLSYYGV